MISKSAFAQAGDFLAPVLNRDPYFRAKGSSIIERLALSHGLKKEEDFSTRSIVIRKALDLLSKIHLSLEASTEVSSVALENLSDRRTLDALLDLVSLEGIYPFLSPGVGIPIERRVKSVIQAGFVTRSSTAQYQDNELLPSICVSLYEIAVSQSLSSSIRDRSLVDLIAGLGELGYSPLTQHEVAAEIWTRKLNTLLDRTPTISLFPILTSLLQPATPTWFRSPIATSLSLLPLRPEGVKSTINFIASTTSPAPYDPKSEPNEPGDISLSPSLSLEVLSQASKLLSSVPSSLTAETYFTALAPQLLKLLDDENIDTKRAAAYVISHGILSRRKYGSPGTIGWMLLAQPIVESFSPEVIQGQAKSAPESDSPYDDLSSIIVPVRILQLQLERLASLLLLHPNPGLTKRLISPCLRQLWSLLCCSKATKDVEIPQKIRDILSIYFKTSVGINQLINLSDDLLWEGDISWMYFTGPGGGFGIRKRQESPKNHDLGTIMQDIDNRVDEFLLLLRSGIANDDEICVLFTHTSKRWLLGDKIADRNPRKAIGGGNGNEPLFPLMYARLTQKILENYKDKVAKNPRRIIELVNQLLFEFISDYAEVGDQKRSALEPSLAGLKEIVNSNSLHTSNNNGPVSTQEDSVEVVSVCLSLASAILSSSEFSPNRDVCSLLEVFRSNLAHLVLPKSHLPTSLSMTATNLIALLDLSKTSALGPENKARPADPYIEDRKTHDLALTFISDLLPPVRAQGISLLTALISKSTPILDIPSTSILLQSLLQDDDDFIYLSAVKALGLLASRHSKTVVRMLLEQYIDVDETLHLNVRIRIGEALLKTVESLGTALVGEVATLVGEAMITVAGCRNQKPKNKELRERELQKEATLQQEAEEAWGEPIPAFAPSPSPSSQRDSEILAAWASPTLSDDPRMRASALSILGTCIETHLAGLGSSLTSTSIDLALSVLKSEPEPDKSVVRRAAVLVIGSLVTAFERAATEGRALGFGFEGEVVAQVADVLRLVGGRDSDEVVRGHVEVVVEGLEAWWMRDGGNGVFGTGVAEGEIRFGLGRGGLKGLSVDPEAGGRRMGIEEVD